MTRLPVSPAHQLATRPPEHAWLVEQLWSEEAVGVIGGEPKCGKSFLALDLAVAVASGTPCLRHFAVPRPGRVLLFAAEDALHVVRQRLDGIAQAAGVALAALDIQVITAPQLRLDLAADAQRLAHTVAALRPRLLLLDPFVRLHTRDENAAGEVAALLAGLRALQRQHQLAVAVVHHAKKSSTHLRAGQALRGSSEFHAWGDSLLYLRRHGPRLTLTGEHRAAPSLDPVSLQLRAQGPTLALALVEPAAETTPPPTGSAPDRIRQVLAAAPAPLPLGRLRAACRLRKATLCHLLGELTRQGVICKTPDGYTMAPTGSAAVDP